MIEIKNLSFSYSGKEAIKNADLVFDDGTITAVVGENGSGKTTLLRLIMGYEKSDSGDVIIDRENIKNMKRADMAKLVSCFPQGRQIPDMSVLETVELGRYPYTHLSAALSEEDKRAVDTAIRRTEISHFLDRSMNCLSYGERQRVYLAMQIAQDTKNCLFDEPTNFMDAGAKFSMLDSLSQMRDEGKCVVCVLHDISLAMSCADRIVVMKNGEIAADGTPYELYKSRSLEEIFGVIIEKIEETDEYDGSYVVLRKNKKPSP